MADKQALMDRIRALSAPLEPLPTGVVRRLEPMPDVRAVIFDIYGTLLVSGSGDVGTAGVFDQGEAMVEALSAAGFPVVSDEVGVAGTEELTRAVMAAHESGRAKGIEQPEVEIRSIWQHVWRELAEQRHRSGDVTGERIERLAVEYECRVNPVWPMPGAKVVLESLAQRELLLGIVSNAQFYTPLMIHALLGLPPEAMGFAPHRCVWSYEESAAKPSPELFARLLKGLDQDGLSPADCLYVGNDMLNDVYAAGRAGLKTALFAGDRRSLRLREDDPRCRIEPDLVITGLEDLLEVLP